MRSKFLIVRKFSLMVCSSAMSKIPTVPCPLWSYEPWHDKTSKMAVHPSKTQDQPGPLLSAWRKTGSLATHWAHSEDADQTGRMPRLIWVFVRRTVILLVFVMSRLIFFFILFVILLSQDKCWMLKKWITRATSWENVFMPYANTKGLLISAFVVRCLDSIITSTYYSWNFKTLDSLCSWVGWFES